MTFVSVADSIIEGPAGSKNNVLARPEVFLVSVSVDNVFKIRLLA